MSSEPRTPEHGASRAPTEVADPDATQDDVRPVDERVSAPLRLHNNRYELVRTIGEGGMGEVHECKDLTIHRSVALKTIRRDRQAKHLEARFVREACVQAQLEHPSVVPVFEVGRDPQGGAFFTMRKVTGIPLDEIIDRKRSGDPRMMTSKDETYSRHRLLSAFAQICLTVHYAHARGVLHRDLKPSNIMLGEFGEVYVLDWGLAKLAPNDDRQSGSRPSDPLTPAAASGSGSGSTPIISSGRYQTMAGTALGTPAYMAPEQIAARELDARADVFALGAVLFEILTLEPLLDDAAIELRQRGGSPVWDARPSVRAPEQMVPPEFDRICVRATAADVDKRYASARALHDLIEAYLDGERDLELRTKLADTLLKDAEERKNKSGDGPDRERAFRDVNRALALAPDDPRGLELLVGLLKEAPPGVSERARQEVIAEGIERRRRAQPFGVILFTVPWLTIYPVLVFLRGVRSIPLALVPPAAWLLAALANYLEHRGGHKKGVIYPTLSISVALALTSLMLGPLFLVPQLTTTLVASIILISSLQYRLPMIAMACGAILLPAIATWAGIIDAYQFESETNLVMTPLFREVRPFNVSLVLTSLDVLLVCATALFTASLRDEIETARSTKVLFAWQLSKLLPPAVSESKRKDAAAGDAASATSATPSSEKPKKASSSSEGVERLLDTEIDSAPLRAVAQTTFTRAAGEQSGDAGAAGAYPLLALDGSRYVDGELLAAGKTSEIYRVRDRLVGRDVAMKRLLQPPTRGEALEVLEAAFTREALLQAHIDHPVVPPIYDLGTDDRGPWFTMKLVRGSPLSDVLKEEARAGDAGAAGRGASAGTTTKLAHGRHQRLAAFTKVCLTIDFAHKHGVVHAALDPSNIVLGEFGEVYILGWSHAKRLAGAAVDARSSTLGGPHDARDHTSEGSREYRAPELTVADHAGADARAATEASDIYALGAILFEMVAGKPASSGARIGRELDEICAKAMAPKPANRYGSARKLHDAVEAFLSRDRDEAMRHDLAAERLARAEAKMDRVADDVAARADVLRNVGRALALAPDRGPALRLLSRLLASPPKQMPPAVKEEVEAQVWAMSKSAAWPGALTEAIIWLVIFPLFLLAFGVRDLRFAIAISLTWTIAAAVLFGIYRFRRSEPRIPWVGITQAIAIGTTSLLFGQYFIMPPLVVTMVLAYVLAVGVRWRWPVVGLCCLAVIIPFVLMWTGVSSDSVLAMPGGVFAPSATFVIRGAAYHPAAVFLLGLTLTNIANVFFVGFYAGGFRDILDELEVENRSKVHALSRLM